MRASVVQPPSPAHPVVDSDGKVVATYVTSKSIQNVVYSSSAVKSGEKYEIHSGGTKSGTGTGGLAASGTLGSAERDRHGDGGRGTGGRLRGRAAIDELSHSAAPGARLEGGGDSRDAENPMSGDSRDADPETRSGPAMEES